MQRAEGCSMDHYSAFSMGHKVIGQAPSRFLCASSPFHSLISLPRSFRIALAALSLSLLLALPLLATDSSHTFIVRIAQKENLIILLD